MTERVAEWGRPLYCDGTSGNGDLYYFQLFLFHGIECRNQYPLPEKAGMTYLIPLIRAEKYLFW